MNQSRAWNCLTVLAIGTMVVLGAMTLIQLVSALEGVL
jgi:hypothetical protein